MFFLGNLFAQAPIDEYPGPSVESVSDSSRYFVLKIQDEGGQYVVLFCCMYVKVVVNCLQQGNFFHKILQSFQHRSICQEIGFEIENFTNVHVKPVLFSRLC